MADREVSCPGRQRPAEPGYERFLKRARAERLDLLGVERAESGEELIDIPEPVIEANAELIELPVLFLDGGEILQRGAGRRERDVPKKYGGGRVDPGCGNLVVREGRADTASTTAACAVLRSCRRKRSGSERSARRGLHRTGSGATAESAGPSGGSSSVSRPRRCGGTRRRCREKGSSPPWLPR
jgi:hypothetical protein